MENTENRVESIGHLIKEGLDGEISLIGFPYSVGASRDKLYIGQERGPDCLRRFFDKVGTGVNGEFGVDIRAVTISDYGNICIDSPTLIQNEDYEKLAQKLQTKVTSVLNKKHIPFVIGGSRDTATAVSLPLLAQSGMRNAIVSVCQFIDAKTGFDGDKASVTSTFRKVIEVAAESAIRGNSEEQTGEKKNNSNQVVFFGCATQAISMEETQVLESHAHVTSVESLIEIRRYPVNLNVEGIIDPITQAGQKMAELFAKLTQTQAIDSIHLSISMESINSAFCPGVTRQRVVGGITPEEIVEIMLLAGKCPQVRVVDITDYNPSNEDLRTGMLIANMLYYFTMGYALRKGSQSNQS